MRLTARRENTPRCGRILIGHFEKCFGFTKAEEIRTAGIYPYFHALESRQDTEVIMEGKTPHYAGLE
jgi:hypothetical protein